MTHVELLTHDVAVVSINSSAEMSPASGHMTQGGYSSATDYGLITQNSFVIQHVNHIKDRLFYQN